MKNLLLFSTILLTSASAFAQLTVKPNGTADSYVYVKNEVLYVAQDVNLTPNPTAATEASIYLRDNGQLIQSGALSTNDGNGFLSVQQNSPVTNAWTYYYWCSPVGNPAATQAMTYGNNKNFGLRSMYEDINATPGIGTNARQTTLITTDLGYTNPALTISKRWVYTHEVPGTEAGADYNRLNGSNYALPGWGFTMKGVNQGTANNTNQSNHNQIYEFRGRPNSGNFTINIGNGLMTLSGNPYPSALDLNKLFYDVGNNELNSFMYYDEDKTAPGSHNYDAKPYGYGVWTPGNEDLDGDPYNGNNMGTYVRAPFLIYKEDGTTVGNTGNSNNNDQNKRFAPVGQGIMFFGEATGPITIRNSQRIFFKEGTTGSVFQRPGGGSNDDTVGNDPDPNTNTSVDATTARPDYRDPQMRIWTIFDEAITRDMLVVFYDQATDGYDRGLDGMHPMAIMGSDTDAYFPVGDDNNRKPYVINAIKYDLEKQVPIAFKLKNQSKFAVKAVEEVKKPYTNAYVYDSQQHTYQQITGGQSASFNLPAGNYENRFYVVFRNPDIKRDAPLSELEEKNTILEKVTFFQNNPAQQLEVLNPEGYTLKSAAVYDMGGKLVINEKNLGDNNRYSFYTGNLSDGVYLVKLTTSNDITIDYRAIVHNK